MRVRNRLPFDDEVLQGPTSMLTATLRISAARLLTAKRIRLFATEWRLNERDVILLVGLLKGIPEDRICEQIGSCPSSVRSLRSRMYAKLGVSSDVRAVLKFVLASGICLSDRDRELVGNRVALEGRVGEDDDGD